MEYTFKLSKMKKQKNMNRDLDAELSFLDDYTSEMPRIMLRYAIEKFPEKLRLEYLKNR